MIVSTEALRGLRGTVTLVDGGFDPIHPGHVRYLRAAAALGLPVLCNVAADDWVAAKHEPLLLQLERAEVIDGFRWVDYVHPAASATVDVLRELRPRYYAKGSDWEERLPGAERDACAEHGIEIVFLDTVTGSSSAILERYERGRLARR